MPFTLDGSYDPTRNDDDYGWDSGAFNDMVNQNNDPWSTMGWNDLGGLGSDSFDPQSNSFGNADDGGIGIGYDNGRSGALDYYHPNNQDYGTGERTGALERAMGWLGDATGVHSWADAGRLGLDLATGLPIKEGWDALHRDNYTAPHTGAGGIDEVNVTGDPWKVDFPIDQTDYYNQLMQDYRDSVDNANNYLNNPMQQVTITGEQTPQPLDPVSYVSPTDDGPDHMDQVTITGTKGPLTQPDEPPYSAPPDEPPPPILGRVEGTLPVIAPPPPIVDPPYTPPEEPPVAPPTLPSGPPATPSNESQFSPDFSRRFNAYGGDYNHYGEGAQHAFYAAHGGAVQRLLQMARAMRYRQ